MNRLQNMGGDLAAMQESHRQAGGCSLFLYIHTDAGGARNGCLHIGAGA